MLFILKWRAFFFTTKSNLLKPLAMHGNSMSVSVKNNLKLLPKRDRFKNRLGGYNPNKKTEYNLPKASKKQLRDIKKRMQSERKLWWLSAISLTSVISILVFCLIKYYL